MSDLINSMVGQGFQPIQGNFGMQPQGFGLFTNDLSYSQPFGGSFPPMMPGTGQQLGWSADAGFSARLPWILQQMMMQQQPQQQGRAPSLSPWGIGAGFVPIGPVNSGGGGGGFGDHMKFVSDPFGLVF